MNFADSSLLIQETSLILAAFVFHYLFSSKLIKGVASKSLHEVLIQRLAGFFFLMIPGISFLTDEPFFVRHTDAWKTAILSVTLSIVAVLVNKYRKRTDNDMNVYPHIRSSHWTTHIIALNTLSWMIYLLPYEYVLRGTLLTHSLSTVNLLSALVLNGIVYSLAHAPQGWRETLWSFPFGILLCIVTIMTGNFWGAYIIHASLAISNDYFAIRNNPAMNFSTPLFPTPWHFTRRTLL